MATELGKAYVQIIPSAQGIKGKITEAIGGEVDSAGQSAGQSLGGKLANTFKTVIAAAGIGTAISTALNEGAALQQSLGGIETLFKTSADTMKQYADEAFRTAGLSANEYMETATGFAASLIQSCGGDTAVAAEIANRAIIDMSDNANKMGTSMESIQNAYQGFAKGNYTMLDNLKLGYGGTQEEMKRLIADASKMTDVQEKLGITVDGTSMDFANVANAISVVQANLDIAGATAKEAESTFSGSMASMLASGKNLIAKLTLGEDIKPALQDLAKTTWTFATGNLMPMLWNIVKGVKDVLIDSCKQLLETDPSIINSVIQSILSKVPELYQKAEKIVYTVLQTITDKLPSILQKGVEIVTNIANGILKNIPTILASGSRILTKFVEFIVQNLPTIVQAGMNLLSNLAQGIKNNLPQIITMASAVVANLLATIGRHLPSILQKGIELIGQLAAGLIRAIPTLVSKIPTIIDRIKEAFSKFDWKGIGKDIISGIANGITSAVGSIVTAAKEAANSAYNAAKKKLGIQSPSKVMEQGVGKWIPAGIAVGIEKNTSMVSKAMNEMTQEASGSINADLSMGISQSKFGSLASAGVAGGYQQNVNIYSPKELSPSEVARQTRNATRNMVLSLQGA